MNFRNIAFAVGLILAATGGAESRDQIRIVGSSTVFPFATTVAEQFGKTTDFKTPVIESTGSGGGLKLFCAGLGVQHPDITNSSRRIKQKEVDLCSKNGVADITEIKIGYDGIVLSNSRSAGQMAITVKQLFMALAKDVPTDDSGETLVPNPHENWSDIDPSLPQHPIEVMGPPPTSGTRDAFVELAMEGGCKKFRALKAMKKHDKQKYKALCHAIREDGAFIEAGENDVLIIQKLVANPNAFGIFGYSFLDQNIDKVQGSLIGGIQPTFNTIANADYPVSRSMYFYVKHAHATVIPGVMEYVAEFTSDGAWGPDGYLAEKGLIPMPDGERAKFRKDGASLAQLEM